MPQTGPSWEGTQDLAIGAVSRLQEVLKKICDGEFCPDAARSGYYPARPQACEAELPLEKVVVKVDDEQTEEEQADAAPDKEEVLADENFDGSSDS